jgi:hypothetical protein
MLSGHVKRNQLDYQLLEQNAIDLVLTIVESVVLGWQQILGNA